MNSSVPVVETFHSIQGEGNHAGRSAFFIRLAGCKVGCPWCDTKDSWDETSHPQKTILDIAGETKRAVANGAAFIVITGGEPLHQNLDLLCNEIRKSTKSNTQVSVPIHLETSGVNPISGNPNWITLSPKRHSPPRLNNLKLCNELKVIIHEVADLKFAEKIAQQAIKLKSSKEESTFSKDLVLFLQPRWQSVNGLNLALEHVKHHPQWRLSLQIHKWLEIE